MDLAKRFRQPWTTIECIQLQKEFDMKLSINEIAKRHQRTANAIMYKLDREGLADYNTLISNYEKGITNYFEKDDSDNSSNYSDESVSEDESDADSEYEPNKYDNYNLHQRVLELENRIDELMEALVSNKKSKVFSSLFA